MWNIRKEGMKDGVRTLSPQPRWARSLDVLEPRTWPGGDCGGGSCPPLTRAPWQTCLA